MLTVERMSEIYGLLQQIGVVRVDELAVRFQVSEMTIRRDLEKMEREGKLTRCHGGAVQKQEIARDQGVDKRASYNLGAKVKIAKYCFEQYVHENTVVYLDAGTTVLEPAKLLPAMGGLTVVTNDVMIASALFNSNVDVFMLGGNVQRFQGCIHGHTAESQLENYRVDMAFVSSLCVDDAFDVFTATENRVYFRRKLLTCARQTFMLLDASKFHRQSLFKVNNLADYSAVITDKTLSEEMASQASQTGIEWIAV